MFPDFGKESVECFVSLVADWFLFVDEGGAEGREEFGGTLVFAEDVDCCV